jgi:hypothetical protein
MEVIALIAKDKKSQVEYFHKPSGMSLILDGSCVQEAGNIPVYIRVTVEALTENEANPEHPIDI